MAESMSEHGTLKWERDITRVFQPGNLCTFFIMCISSKIMFSLVVPGTENHTYMSQCSHSLDFSGVALETSKKGSYF